MNLIVVYAAPSVSRRSTLWGNLKTVVDGLEGPLIIGGDFNTIVRLDERVGGNGRLSADSLAFGEWIHDLMLIDMGFKGSRYTWRRGREESNFVAKRLDRILCCPQARLKWQEATVSHLPVLASDHAPLLLQLVPVGAVNPRRRPFRFEAAWLQHSGFKELLVQSWDANLTTPEALRGLQSRLKKWNKEVFGDVNKRKADLFEAIALVQNTLDILPTDDLIVREGILQQELDQVLEQEEMIWFQKSREKWITEGDRNTKFFHTSTVIRRRRNRVESLKNLEGVWVSDPQALEEHALTYYSRLYSLSDVAEIADMLPHGGFEMLTHEELRYLTKPFTGPEVVDSIRSMGRFKAPGPDGFQPVFYQDCWEVVGESVIRFVLDFFQSSRLSPGLNDALVVLIPKVVKPESIMQFRPISLCNVLFKIITKTMVTRMKRVMMKLIGPAQASFIPGRLSTDNIIIVQEVVHSMRRKKGRKGWMLLKLDLEKAYDRIRWDFLSDTLIAAGFPESWRNWIMSCVAGPSMTLLWNGEKTTPFKIARGLRQGDPLSPYLFVLCLERLCHLIEVSVASKEWKPVHLSRGGPLLSHVCFADDLILFAEASVSQVRVIRRVLERFCLASGQKVSLEKSKIFFSANVSREQARSITDASGIQSTCDLGKYLGMPILHKRINKETFGTVVERVASRLAGWRGRFLSLAGRVTLTKSVLSSIPIHTMATIALPASILEKLDSLSRAFVWGNSTHLIAWDKCCLSKANGGLGIRKSKFMNKALVAKVGWRLIHDKDGLWARVLRSKYKVDDLRVPSWLVTKGTWSSTWRSIAVGLHDVVLPGLSWVVGDGTSIRFWKDCWLHDRPLLELASNGVPESADSTVREFWLDSTGWDLPRILPYISEDSYLQLLSRIVDTQSGCRDRLSWGAGRDGKFTVSSAYAFLTRECLPLPQMSSFFERIWKTLVPERVRLFLWLVGHQVIMTNMERKRRHLSLSSVCQVCRGGDESILHILRDCPAMEGIWRRFVEPAMLAPFFDMTLLEWLYSNLGNTKEVNGCSWASLFATAIWWAWKWRCDNVFGGNGRCRDRVKYVRDKAVEGFKAHMRVRHTGAEVVRVERLISWKPPEVGWFKLNTDGASRGNPGVATAGGVLRDNTGAWCGGFALNIGKCSAPLAELWGVYYGLHIAWEKGISQLELEVDSEVVVRFLSTRVEDTHPLSFLVHLCYGFLEKDWLVRVTHVYREANRLADGLANYAFTLPLGLHLCTLIPDVLSSILVDDANGSAYPRMIPV